MFKLRSYFAVLVFFIILRFFVYDKSPAPIQEELVAHGCGEINGIRITNSVEALDNNYKKGFHLFEADMEKSTDGCYILIHDWGRLKWDFGVEPKPCSAEDFQSLNMIDGLTQMTIDDLVHWLKTHKDAYIITDVKTDNTGLLRYIKKNSPGAARQIIPQAYSFEEYYDIEAMGYKNIILTLYKTTYTADEVIEFAEENSLFAVTIHRDTAKSGYAQKLKENNIFVYAHTINDGVERDALKNKGVGGFYTDFLAPKQLNTNTQDKS